MATCNGARFLGQQLDDIARQTQLPDELVICDDCSEDATLDILKQFKDRAPFPVRIHSNGERLGYRQNFVRAAGLCQSDIVFFCDQDDRWAQEKLETVLACFERPETQLVFHQADLIDAEGKSLAGSVYPFQRSQRFKALGFSPWETPLGFTQAFRRHLTRFDRFWSKSFDPTTEDQPLAHDQWYIFLAGVFGAIEYSSASLAGYRQHGSNTFGIDSVRIPLRERISRKISEAGMSLDRRRSAADKRAGILLAIEKELADEEASSARTGAREYRRLAERCRRRAALYRAEGPGQRVAVMRDLFGNADYGRDAWRFGTGALAMDLAVGLPGIRPSPPTEPGDRAGQHDGGAEKVADAQPSRKRRRILFLLPFAPDMAARDGGTRAMTGLIEAMAQKHEVHVAWLAPDSRSPSGQVPDNLAATYEIPLSSRAAGSIARWASLLLRQPPSWVRESRSRAMIDKLNTIFGQRSFDVVQCEFHVMAQYLPQIRSSAPEALRIVTEHEPGIRADEGHRSTGLKARLSKKLRQAGWARYEKRTLSDAEGVVVFTEADQNAIEHLLNGAGPKVRTIPLQVQSLQDRDSDAPIYNDMLFFGNFNHPPNVDSALRLIRSVFPLIREKRPSAGLILVGPNPTRSMQESAGEGIQITGEVPSVQPYLAGASIVLAPVFMGGGMRVKVLETCAAGRALVASPLAVCGLSLAPGRDCEVAADEIEMASIAVDLLGDAPRRKNLGSGAREWARQCLDQAAWIREYDAFYDLLEQQRANP